MIKHVVLAVVAVTLVAGCQTTGERKPGAADLRSEIGAALKANPDLVMDILKENKVQVYRIVEQGVAEAREEDARKQLEAELKNPRQPAVDTSRPMLGVADAPVTIVEYSDFLCPYCGRGARIVKELVARHPGRIRVIFKHVPLSEESLQLARIFEAVSLQSHDLAWRFHDLVFEAGKTGTDARGLERILDALAAQGLNRKRLKTDLDRPEVEARIESDMEEAGKFGFRGTPMFLVNGVLVQGAQPLEAFEKVLQAVSKGSLPEAANK